MCGLVTSSFEVPVGSKYKCVFHGGGFVLKLAKILI